MENKNVRFVLKADIKEIDDEDFDNVVTPEHVVATLNLSSFKRMFQIYTAICKNNLSYVEASIFFGAEWDEKINQRVLNQKLCMTEDGDIFIVGRGEDDEYLNVFTEPFIFYFLLNMYKMAHDVEADTVWLTGEKVGLNEVLFEKNGKYVASCDIAKFYQLESAE